MNQANQNLKYDCSKVTTADGVEISACFFSTIDHPKIPRGLVLIVPAMGTPQTYYAPFAAWLASSGYVVATFDYRGIGQSRPRRLRHFRADITDWALRDCAAVMETLARRSAGVPLYWIGHSLGGQILPFLPNHQRIAKAIMIASGSGYWRDNAKPLNRYVWWLWFVAAPIATRLCGFFPGKTLRKVGDLPTGVIMQWRRWCLHPDYALGDGDDVCSKYAAVKTPIVALSFHDDEYLSIRSSEALQRFYENASVRIKWIGPQDIGMRRIGHFGFFRAQFEGSLWANYIIPELLC